MLLEIKKMRGILKNGQIRLENQQLKLANLEIQIQTHQAKIEAAKKPDNKKN